MELIDSFLAFFGFAEIGLAKILLLIFIAFSAGFVDAVVGGGGLIMVPGLINILPQYAIPTLFGTNKIASITGTTLAAYKYSQKVVFNWQWLIPAALIAAVFAIAGGALAVVVPTHIFRPIILIFLLWVAYLTFFPPKIKKLAAQNVQDHKKTSIKLILICGLIAFYDGFIGPGTGIFLIFCFVHFWQFDFLQASAYAKVINVASNLGALIFFIPTGHFIGNLAILLIICNISGAFFGSSLAIKKGEKFVAIFFRIMVVILITKFIYDSIIIFANY